MRLLELEGRNKRRNCFFYDSSDPFRRKCISLFSCISCMSLVKLTIFCTIFFSAFQKTLLLCGKKLSRVKGMKIFWLWGTLFSSKTADSRWKLIDRVKKRGQLLWLPWLRTQTLGITSANWDQMTKKNSSTKLQSEVRFVVIFFFLFNIFLNFSCMFLNPTFFFQFEF